MSWRVVTVSGISKLDYKMGHLVVRGVETKRIHLSEIAIVIVENTAVSLTAYLLSELSKAKIKVIFCDEKRNPASELVSYYGSYDTSDKVRRQMEWTEEAKVIAWTAIVSEKIFRQAKVLEKVGCFEEAQQLLSYLEELELGDVTNREGHAAKVYFNSLFGKEHSRGADNAVNAALNYGYTILLSAFNREIVANGYLTQFGIFHDNGQNPFNLASDFMEPFRCIVDLFVKQHISDSFGTEDKHRVLDIVNAKLLIDGKSHFLMNAISIYCKSVFVAIEQKNPSAIKFYEPE